MIPVRYPLEDLTSRITVDTSTDTARPNAAGHGREPPLRPPTDQQRADLQRIIEVAAMAYGVYKGHAFEDLDKHYQQKMIDEGVEVIVWNEKEVERAMQAGKALWPEFAVNDLSRKVWDSQLKYMRMIGLMD